MNNYNIEFRIGVVVLVALATLVLLVGWFGKHSIVNFGDEYTLRIRFQAAPGVKINTPVMKSGVQIGRVTKVALVDEDREVEVTIQLPLTRKIYTNEECRVRQRMIMGDSTLEFVKKQKYTGPIEAVSHDAPPLIGATPLDLVGGFANIESDLQKAITSVTHTAETMSSFIDRINAFLGSPDELKKQQSDIQATVREMTETMRSLRALSDGAGTLFNDPAFQSSAKKIVQELPDILETSRNLLADSDSFLKELRAAVVRGTATLDKVDQGLDNLQQLSGDGSDALQAVQSAAKRIDSFVSDISSLLAAVGSSDTPILQRLLQPEVAENLAATIRNVHSITEQFDLLLRNDVKPITHNVKIITDKVARDPSVFIRNLIRKQPPIKNGIPIWGDGLGSDSLDSDYFDLEPVREEMIYQEDVPMYEPAMPSFARQRSATISERIASFFSASKPVAATVPSTKLPPSAPVWEELPPSEPAVDDEPPPILLPPQLASSPLPTSDVIPAEGRIVHIDPRYGDIEEPTPYRQMSYTTESTATPRLVFSR